MRRSPALLLLLVLSAGVARADLVVPPAPTAEVRVVRDTLHGDVVEDPYRWLETRGAPETEAFVTAQMARTRQVLGQVPGRDRIAAALDPLLRTDTRSTPTRRGGRDFFTTRAAGQQLPVIAMRPAAGGDDVVLVDPNTWGGDGRRSATLMDVSADGRQLVYGVRSGGEDELEVRRFDVDARRDLPGTLPKARYFGVELAPDGESCWYSNYVKGQSGVWFHRFADDPANDRRVFGEGLPPAELAYSTLSDDGRWLLITVLVGSSGNDTRVYVKDVRADGPVTPVVEKLGASFRAAIDGDRLYLLTNWQAPRRRVLLVDLHHPEREAWKTVVPESPDMPIESFALGAGRVWLQYLHDVTSKLRWVPLGPDGLAAGPAVDVALPGMGKVSGLAGRAGEPEVFWDFESFDRPRSIVFADARDGATHTWWQSPIPFESARFEVRQVWVNSTDGARVPMFLFQRRGARWDGSNPVLLNGYGGFNQSSTPAFSALAAAWVELGGVWASAGLRGGGEFGEAWHRAGMLESKQHTFDDFIACSEWLVKNRVTRPAKLAIRGGSNGGLLVSACMTQRPDLFGAVVCAVPLIDMLRYQNFLVARFWVPEYGSSEDATQYRWLRAYSPYQHVRAGVKYPATLIVSGDSDTRVDPCHARKFAALLQARSAGGPVLLHYETESGHSGGGTPLHKQVSDNTDVLAFLTWRLGVPTANATVGHAR